jgi:rhodanese-related sulfurtransferase
LRSPGDTLLGMVTLLCLSLSLGLVGRFFVPEPPPLFTPYHGTIPENVKVASPEEAYKLYEDGGSAFVDAREWERYAYAHIPGALHLPVDDFEQYTNELVYLRTSHMVVVYCEDIHCGASKKLVELLVENRVKDLILMPEGLAGWQAEGYPVLGESDG